MDFKDKKIIVSGVAKSGIAAAVLLKKLGAFVTIQDSKPYEKLGDEPAKLEALGINLYLGKNPDDIVKDNELIIVSPGVPCNLPFFDIAKENNVPVWSEMELGYRLCRCPVIAITGTNGKTTTTSITGEIFKNMVSNTAVVGNIGVPFTEKVLELKEDSYAIAEVSSFQLETIHKFKPKAAAVLNITPDHLNRHKTVENYIAAKERIFENQDENDFLILNYDDEICRKMSQKAKGKVVFFSYKKELHEGVYYKNECIYARLLGKDELIINVNELNILGSHNIENAMAAVAIAICMNIPKSVIIKTLREFKAVAHRIEYVETINNIEFYNDSKGTNPDAAIKAIDAMKRKIILIGGGYDKGSDFSEWIKKFEGKVKYLVVIGEVADKIIDTAEKFNFKNYSKASSLKSAVELCYSKAKPGDCVLLSPACASWDMFDSYEQRGELFKKFVFELR